MDKTIQQFKDEINAKICSLEYDAKLNNQPTDSIALRVVIEEIAKLKFELEDLHLSGK